MKWNLERIRDLLGRMAEAQEKAARLGTLPEEEFLRENLDDLRLFREAIARRVSET